MVCSPNSAQSIWVGQEIEYFASLGRTENIHFFIVDGTPHSDDAATECFNPIIEKVGLPETLGANIHERVSRWAWVNRERAYVQIIAKLLGVEFDSHVQRFTEAEQMLKTATEIFERLAQTNPERFEPKLADFYNNLAALYRKANQFDKSEQMHNASIEIRSRLAKTNPKAYEERLAECQKALQTLKIEHANSVA